MDSSIFTPFANNVIISSHSIPYLIILINFFLFNLLRMLVNRLFYLFRQHNKVEDKEISENRKLTLIKILINELISTCELCADCAELNVIYEKHGSFAYGLVLFILTYLWIDTFGDAHTTPGYLVEDYFLIKGNDLLKVGDTYARFIGQSLAMPMAWRLASIYWTYHLLDEHKTMLVVENCKTSLNVSTLNGLIIELTCCFICRLLELIGHRLIESKSSFLHASKTGKRVISFISSFICTLLVVISLELSGGYFNPVLASSLEYGCKGIDFYQHTIVFWIGPLVGHIMARALFRRYVGDLVEQQIRSTSSYQKSTLRQVDTTSASTKRISPTVANSRRQTRSSAVSTKQTKKQN